MRGCPNQFWKRTTSSKCGLFWFSGFRGFKCESVRRMDGQRTPRHDDSSLGLWPGELNKNKKWYKKITQKTKDRATQTPLNLELRFRFSGKVNCSCSTCVTRRVTIVILFSPFNILEIHHLAFQSFDPECTWLSLF